jgi:hypothetical protein
VLENKTYYKMGNISTCDFKVVKGCAACFEAKVILGPDLSQGWTCLRAGLVSGQDLSKHFGAGLVSGLDLSRGWSCPKTLGQEVSKSFKAGSVSQPEVSKSSGPEVSRGRKCPKV